MAIVELDPDDGGGADDASASLSAVADHVWTVDDGIEALAVAHGGLDLVQGRDLAVLGDDEVRSLVHGLDHVLRRAHATLADALAEVDRRGHHRELGFFSTRAWTRHHHRLSGSTALARTQVVRLFQLLPSWAQAARRGSSASTRPC